MVKMEPIDFDEIIDVNFPNVSGQDGGQSVEAVFKDGKKTVFGCTELPEVLAILNHWTPPAA